jgi:Fe-S-cluster containining protein
MSKTLTFKTVTSKTPVSKTVTGQGTLKIGGQVMQVRFTVPAGRCGAEALLPDLRRLAGQATNHAVAAVERDGQRVSCAKGCGACCRQMVPVSPVEARELARMVAAMPPERAAAVRQRFVDARQRIEAASLGPARGHPDGGKAAYRAYSLAYFSQGVPCPFLEDESCSIHPERPLVCREYLVTSTPDACAAPGAGGVRMVPVPLSPWAVLSRAASDDGRLEWMPLIESLDYAASHPAPTPRRTGPQYVEAVLRIIKS